MISYGRQNIDKSDIDAVSAVLNGNWLTQGPYVEEFEEIVADYVGAKFAVAFSSATAALHACAAAAGIGPGDKLYTSPLTFMSSANTARFVGASPRLVDIDSATWNIDLSQIPENANAVVPVHFAGLPVDLQQLNAGKHIVIEDAAHALGAKGRNGAIGNCAHSDMCCFSFHPVKPITTGEGGMATTNDADLANRLRLFRSHGIVRQPENGGWFYQISDLGFNYRMTDLQAALGTSQMKRLDFFIGVRNEIAASYRHRLKDLDLELPPSAPDGSVHGYHLFPILVNDRRHVFDELQKVGIGVQVHYVPVHHHPISVDTGLTPSDLPKCNHVYERIISLPIHPGLVKDDQDFVVEQLKRLLS
jgi:UDP-4-amino-4,6-dideoxy-N-acetyl-beta-L-altrosamine transaminase